MGAFHMDTSAAAEGHTYADVFYYLTQAREALTKAEYAIAKLHAATKADTESE